MKHPYYVKIFIIIFMPVALYFNTLFNDYALDDSIVITKNEFVKEGFSGIGDILKYDTFTGFFGVQKNLVSGGRYRPLSLITFAIEYQFFGLNAFISHLINILVFTLLCFLIFKWLHKLLQTDENSSILSFPFIATLIFIAHPVHTEVVANIKGRDELLVLLFSILAFISIFRFIDHQKINHLLISLFTYFLGLMSKENAAAFLILTPLILLIFKRINTKQSITIITSFSIVTLAFLFIRWQVLGNIDYTPNQLMNNPFLNSDVSQKYGTIFYTLLMYIKLLIFPHPLTYDYYPYHIGLVTLFSWQSIIGIITYILILFIGILKMKSNPIISVGVFIYLIPLFIVSNILFPVGTFMNERFIFVSSLGFAIIVTFLLLKLKPKYLYIILIPVLSLYSFKVIDRNLDWKDDYTLFTTDVKVSKNSAKANTTAGGSYWEKSQKTDHPETKNKLLDRSIYHLKKAIDIHPKYNDALLLLGNAMWDRYQSADSVIRYYKKILDQNPIHTDAHNNLAVITRQIDNDPNAKLRVLLFRQHYLNNDSDLLYAIGKVYGKGLENPLAALEYLTRAYQENPDNVDLIKDIGVAYGMSGNFEKSIEYSTKAAKLAPDDPEIWVNLGISHHNTGQLEKARQYFEKAEKLKQNNSSTNQPQ